jgi:hypothetical protein
MVEYKVDNLSLPEVEIGSGFKRAPHLASIPHAISLSSRRLHRGTTGTIEQPELNSCAIYNPAHNAAERVDFSHEVSLRDSTNGGIAGHLADEIQIQRNEAGFRAQSSRGRSGLTARMAGANHYYIEDLVKRHGLFPDTKRCEYL